MMQATILLLSLLLGAYSVVDTGAREITVTHFTATSNTISLRWRKRVGDTHLTDFKVAYIGNRNYHDRSNAMHDIVSYGEAEVVRSDRILLTNLTHCTNYTITVSGWNNQINVTNEPLYIRTLPTVVRPVVPSVATQLKSDGRTHAVVTIYPTADNLGCKKYQLIVVIADNVTESQEWTLSSLAEALTDQVRNVYITAEFSDTAPLNTIELGDGKYYGRYFNNPLLPGSCYRVAIRIVYDDSELYPTYSELTADPWCLEPIVPAVPDTVNKSTAGKSIGISFGIIGGLFLLIAMSWGIVRMYQRRDTFYRLLYSDKVIKGPSLWDFVRGKKGPTILEQLISVDYHEHQSREYSDDENLDMLSSDLSIVRDFSRNRLTPERSYENILDDPPTPKILSEESSKISSGSSSKISSGGSDKISSGGSGKMSSGGSGKMSSEASETQIENANDPATDLS